MNPTLLMLLKWLICGSYQCDRLFGDTAGVHAYKSLYVLCWSQIRKMGFWDRLDLEHILTEGDSLC